MNTLLTLLSGLAGGYNAYQQAYQAALDAALQRKREEEEWRAKQERERLERELLESRLQSEGIQRQLTSTQIARQQLELEELRRQLETSPTQQTLENVWRQITPQQLGAITYAAKLKGVDLDTLRRDPQLFSEVLAWASSPAGGMALATGLAPEELTSALAGRQSPPPLPPPSAPPSPPTQGAELISPPDSTQRWIAWMQNRMPLEEVMGAQTTETPFMDSLQRSIKTIAEARAAAQAPAYMPSALPTMQQVLDIYRQQNPIFNMLPQALGQQYAQTMATMFSPFSTPAAQQQAWVGLGSVLGMYPKLTQLVLSNPIAAQQAVTSPEVKGYLQELGVPTPSNVPPSVKANIEYTQQRTKEAEARTRLTWENVNVAKKRIQLMDAQIARIGADVRRLGALTDKLRSGGAFSPEDANRYITQVRGITSTVGVQFGRVSNEISDLETRIAKMEQDEAELRKMADMAKGTDLAESLNSQLKKLREDKSVLSKRLNNLLPLYNQLADQYNKTVRILGTLRVPIQSTSTSNTPSWVSNVRKGETTNTSAKTSATTAKTKEQTPKPKEQSPKTKEQTPKPTTTTKRATYSELMKALPTSQRKKQEVIEWYKKLIGGAR
jgi:hypothetical protein